MKTLLALAALLAASPVSAEMLYTQKWRNEARGGPGAYYGVKGTLSKGVRVTVMRIQGDWAEISLPPHKAWMAVSSLGTQPPKESVFDAFSRMRDKLTPQKYTGAAVAAVRGFALRHGRAKASDVDGLMKLQPPFFTPSEYEAFKRESGAKPSKVGPGDVLSDYDPALQEEGAGLGIAARVAAKGLEQDRALLKYVNMLGAQLAEASGAYAFPFKIYVTKDSQVNALAAPGGYVFLSKRLLAACESEAELAAVIAHEMTHVIRKHGLREIKKREQNLRAEAAMAELDAAGGEGPDPDAEAELSDFADAAYEAVHKPRLQEYEEEADRGAMVMLARAGYDPRAVPRMIERVGAAVVKDQTMETENPFAKMDYKARADKATAFLKERLSGAAGAVAAERFKKHIRL